MSRPRVHASREEYFKAKVDAKRERYRRYRKEFLDMYGGCCAMCGFANPLALHLDHVRGDGCDARRKENSSEQARSNYWSYRAAVDCGYDPTRYRILCANCNYIEAHRLGKLTVPRKGKTPPTVPPE